MGRSWPFFNTGISLVSAILGILGWFSVGPGDVESLRDNELAGFVSMAFGILVMGVITWISPLGARIAQRRVGNPPVEQVNQTAQQQVVVEQPPQRDRDQRRGCVSITLTLTLSLIVLPMGVGYVGAALIFGIADIAYDQRNDDGAYSIVRPTSTPIITETGIAVSPVEWWSILGSTVNWNETYIVYGDLQETGSCTYTILEPGGPLPTLDQGLFLYAHAIRLEGGTLQQRLDEAQRIVHADFTTPCSEVELPWQATPIADAQGSSSPVPTRP